MTSGQVIAFFLFAIIVSATPGPSNLILTSRGAAVGVLRGLPALLGQVIGVGLMLFLIGFGVGTLVLENALIVQALKWFGIGFLLWLAWKIASAGRSGHQTKTATGAEVGFWQMAAFQWVNPKSWLLCTGAVGTYFPAATGSAIARSLLFALLFILAALPSCSIWLIAGAGVQRMLQSERATRVFNLTMGGLLASSVLLFVH